ncbi:MAG: peptide chain release factor N(5)-glutamine methyltransferase [Atopobiaceae bacterium]|nr:peptide chain release factor N(5)-glutamine methyltransferase [Atopobiaceae bacterium]
MADEIWTVKKILDWTVGYLDRKGDERPRLSAEWLLSAATGLSRVEIYINFDKPLMPDELALMREGVRRRAAGEPLQYVTGEMPFRHIVLKCEPGVLIPRPETEVLVDAVLEGLEGRELPRVLDLCTGTGCIALSVATEHSDTVVIATDISPKACALAERNSRALGREGWVDVLECDLAEGVVPAFEGTFDVLVSNPPYIPTAVLAEQVPSEVRDFEPALALDGGADGLDIFRRILELAPRMLKPGGLLACELFEEALDAAADLVRAEGRWEGIEVREDLTNRPRIIIARLEG